MVSEQGLSNPSDIRMYQKLIPVSFDNTKGFFTKRKNWVLPFFLYNSRSVKEEELWQGGLVFLHAQTLYCYVISDGEICNIKFHCKIKDLNCGTIFRLQF